MWITNASKATWYFVLAYTDKDKGYKGLTGFIVPANTPGITVNRKEQNMGQRASDTRGVTFENVEVPAANVLGGAEGTGWFQAMGAFDKSRPFVASASVGVARAAYEHAKAYSLERTTFGKPIAYHQAVSFMLADMAMNIQAARHLVRESAWRDDLKNTKEAAFLSRLLPICATRFAPMPCRSMAFRETLKSTLWRSSTATRRLSKSIQTATVSVRFHVYPQGWEAFERSTLNKMHWPVSPLRRRSQPMAHIMPK